MNEAVALVLAVLGGKVLPSVRCGYPGCRQVGDCYRNGVWCPGHARKLERLSW